MSNFTFGYDQIIQNRLYGSMAEKNKFGIVDELTTSQCKDAKPVAVDNQTTGSQQIYPLNQSIPETQAVLPPVHPDHVISQLNLNTLFNVAITNITCSTLSVLTLMKVLSIRTNPGSHLKKRHNGYKIVRKSGLGQIF